MIRTASRRDCKKLGKLPIFHHCIANRLLCSRLRNTIPRYIIELMAHVIQNKKKLLSRISRIRGQINGIEKALNEERECGEVLLTLAACRGAMNALMAEILEGHVRLHLLQSNSQKDAAVAAAGEELIEVIKRYLK